MKLHTLRVTAFGPFADTVEVDFDEVSAAGLFLIQGPTGAGKTSLLDAICYALYAGLPGARRGSRRLRSDHAADTAVPQVRLDFTTGRRRFRVTRSPEFERPKKRGTGTTRAPATVLLEEHTGGTWVVRSTRNDEVGEIVTEVLGMGLEQFSKVVLLPQGEFSAFLRADAEERRALLERLFDISTWTGVEEWLVEQRRLLAEQVEAARAVVTTDLARLRDAVVTLPPEVAGEQEWTLERLAGLPSALDALIGRCEEHVGSTLTELDAADGAVTRAEQARLEAEALAERQRRAAAARAQLGQLDEAEPDVVAATRRVERSRRAALVSADVRARDRAVGRVRSLASDADALRRRLSIRAEAGPDASTVEQVEQVEQVERVARRHAEHGAALDDARRADHELQAASRRQGQLRVQVDAATSQQADLEAATEPLLAAQLGARAAVDAHRERARQHTALRARHEVLGELLWVSAALRKAQASAARLADEHREARDAELAAHEASLTARQSRLDGMAAELASRLEDEHPCPVCGASEHPLPAAPHADAVSPEQVARAEEVWHERRGRRDRVAAALAAAEADVRSRTTDLARQLRAADDRDGDGEVADARDDAGVLAAADPDAWQTELTGVQAALRELSDPAGTTATLETRAAAAVEAVAEHQRRSADAGQRLAAARALLTDVGSAVSTWRGQRVEALRAHASCPCVGRSSSAEGAPDAETTEAVVEVGQVDALTERHTAHGDGLRALEARLRSAAEAGAELVECEARLTQALTERGFGSAQEVRAAEVDESELERLETFVQSVRARRAAAQAVLADPAVHSATTGPPADAPGAITAAHDARSRHRVAQQRDVVAQQAHQQLSGLVTALRTACARLSPLQARADQVSDLAGLVTGVGADNSLRMRLSSFVLAARLEKVAALANERLAVMGDGRYQLQHSDGLDAGRRRSGLGLVVRDLWTGAVRDTSTLSGGESFMASLALALGLADAVREEAGGFDLQTLFVDEGFGTLDDDSLDEVLTVLDGLREGGRAVGVVSHVSDLLTRIPTQVCVTKTQAGSSVSVRSVSGQTSAA